MSSGGVELYKRIFVLVYIVRVCPHVDVKLSNSTTGLLIVCMGTYYEA